MGRIKLEAARDGSVQSKPLACSEDLLCVEEVGQSPPEESDRLCPADGLCDLGPETRFF